jgi:pimeloyl-ACP methyl ester carboxylesterase
VAKDYGKCGDEISARYILVGWSFGRMIVMTMAARFPKFYSRLVLVVTAPIDGFTFMGQKPTATKEEALSSPFATLVQDAIDKKDKSFFYKIANDVHTILQN